MATSEGGAAPPLHARVLDAVSRTPLTARRAARIIASVTITVTVVSGVLMHWADPKNFPNIGRGLWWAVQTVTTVGYGDVVPRTTAGKLVATLVMVVGIGFLTVMTAAITSTFVEATRRRMVGDQTELLSAKLDQVGARLDAIETGLENIAERGA
ncbi:MAG TPA: potassium channel family protein [Solirubrobacteraceae bacterium]|nr:potassium channel family protein [Solirubrobacteraceae bacterium]